MLGGVFTSVMTGNMVLLGTAATRPDATLAWHALVAIGCFVSGCAIGARIAGAPVSSDSVWPAPVQRALCCQLVLSILFAAGYEHVVGTGRVGERLLVLGVGAVALGMQSSTVQRFGVPGLSTTYLTGTLTTVVIRLATGHGVRHVASNLAILAGLIGGAAIGGGLAGHATRFAPLVGLGCVLVAVLGGRTLRSPSADDVLTTAGSSLVPRRPRRTARPG